jgi:four helix bundle protein
MAENYRDLRVWKMAMSLALEVYRATQSFPKSEVYGLASQLQRAAISIPSNIAEGKGRSTDKDFSLFLHHARGSLFEVETQVMIARELGYVAEGVSQKILDESEVIAKSLNALIGSLKVRDAA